MQASRRTAAAGPPLAAMIATGGAGDRPMPRQTRSLARLGRRVGKAGEEGVTRTVRQTTQIVPITATGEGGSGRKLPSKSPHSS